MSAHAYWRVWITRKSADIYIREIEMRATVGGTDQCNGGAAIFSSESISFGNGYGAFAFDNNNSNRWHANNADIPCFIGYHFQAPVDVAQLSITCVENGIEDFEVQFSDDGTTWNTATTYINQSPWGNGSTETRLFNAFIGEMSGNIIESLPINDWHVVATRCYDGALMGHGFTSGSTYFIDTITLEACNITLSPKISYAWSAAKVAAVNDYVVAVNPDSTPHLWKCTSVTGDAKTGANQPTWNLSGTTSDGNVTWTYVAPLVDPLTLGPKIPAPK